MTMTEAIRTAYSVPLGLSNKSIIKERDNSRAAMFFKLLSPRLWTFPCFSITYFVYDTLYCTGITKRLTVRWLNHYLFAPKRGDYLKEMIIWGRCHVQIFSSKGGGLRRDGGGGWRSYSRTVIFQVNMVFAWKAIIYWIILFLPEWINSIVQVCSLSEFYWTSFIFFTNNNY